ncbi:benzoylformate decarboxylase [Cupriavidus sp. 2TAF22]|uniref:benzoylformate decarboxylase n=1 Tax=unclassified Cupriavidus TaxID=2640874 RepID=UPI003F902990
MSDIDAIARPGAGIPQDECTVRQAVFELLRSLNMTTIFGNPGTTELPMFHDFPEDFRYILGLQESVVVGMADGFAQASGGAALVNLHSAAGVGHAMGNIYTAFKNQTPLVITAGQQDRSILPYDPFLFSAQPTELPKPYVKWACEPARAEDVPAAIARAYYIAMQAPRGPTFVSIPMDDWNRPASLVATREVSFGLRPDPQAIAGLAEALKTARNPVFVVGAGVDRDGAWGDMLRLAEQYQGHVWVSPMSARCSFPEDHALFAGFLPPYRERIVECLHDHDVICVVGAPVFSYHAAGVGPHIPVGSKLYQLTDDPDHAAGCAEGTSIRCTLRLGVRDLLACNTAAAPPRRRGRQSPPRVSMGSGISTAFLMQTLSESRPANSVVVEEAASSRIAMQSYLHINEPKSFFTCSSGGLGHAMPASVGVALADPSRRTIGLFGDGSSMYAIQSLWTAAQLKLPMTMIIVNNQRYAALENYAAHFDLPEPVGTSIPAIDFVALARAQGWNGKRVSDPGELHRDLEIALRSNEPFLVEVTIVD